MNEQYEITEAELEIMQVLWKNKRGNLTTIMEELSKKSKNEERNKNTIKTLIHRLIQKGAIESQKVNNKEVKYKYSNNGYYHNDTKQGTLAEYLNKTYLNTLSYKDKIKEKKFANGIYSSTTNYDYSKVLTTTVDTKVSVLSIGNIILNNNNTNYFLSTGVSKDSNLVYVMQDDYKVYTKVSTTTLKIVPTIALDKSLLTKGDGTIESPYEVE